MRAEAKVVRHDNDALAQKFHLPVYVWSDSKLRPKAMVLAVHGLSMHGTVFDATARHLAAQHFLVAAIDLRGYGKWYQRDAHSKASYRASEQDLVAVAAAMREGHPGIPLFLIGESLGGTVAVRVAARHSELVDGLVLSAPALRYHQHLGIGTVGKVALLATNPTRKIDLSNYINTYFSNEERVTKEALADPLMRKRLGIGELISSCRFMSGSAQCISEIPVDMPVLMMQGKQDRMVKAESIELLEKKLKSSKRTVRWFPERGHILLETAHVHPETLEAVSSWLEMNCTMRTSRTTASAAEVAIVHADGT